MLRCFPGVRGLLLIWGYGSYPPVTHCGMPGATAGMVQVVQNIYCTLYCCPPWNNNKNMTFIFCSIKILHSCWANSLMSKKICKCAINIDFAVRLSKLSSDYIVKPVLRDHCHERPPVLTDQTILAEGPTFQYKWTCHQRPPVLTDHIFVANGTVFQDRFYCISDRLSEMPFWLAIW